MMPKRHPDLRIGFEPLTTVGWDAGGVVGKGSVVETNSCLKTGDDFESLRYKVEKGFRVPPSDFVFDSRRVTTSAIICASKSRMSARDCGQGDSGGPLIVRGGSSWEKDLAVGILSFDVNECNGNNPTSFMLAFDLDLPKHSLVSRPTNLPNYSAVTFDLPTVRFSPPPLRPPSSSPLTADSPSTKSVTNALGSPAL